MDNKELKECIAEYNPKALMVDGFDDAIIGIAERCGSVPLVAYSTNAIIKILMERDGLDSDEAYEYYNFNIVGSFVGEGTPIFINSLDTC